jgi:hypothetical protein
MMTHSETLTDLAAALAKAQGEIKGALKTADNPFHKSKYADLASVWDACREPLSKNGLSVVQTTSNEESKILITTMLLHVSGQWIRDTLAIKPKEDTPQGVGSTITYGRRYALSAIVGVAPEDDDGEAASGRGARPAKQADTAVIRQQFQQQPTAARPPAPVVAGNIVTPQAKPATV